MMASLCLSTSFLPSICSINFERILELRDVFSIIAQRSDDDLGSCLERNQRKIIEEEDKTKLYDLVAELRQLPDDLPPPEDVDDPEDHPLLKLMVEKGEWFVRLWPIIQSIVQTRIASYDSPSDFEEGSSHSDFIP